MKQLKFTPSTRVILADTVTPVSIYLRLRTLYPNAILLESSDYHGHENAWSYICFNPVACFTVEQGKVTKEIAGRENQTFHLSEKRKLESELDAFFRMFEATSGETPLPANGLFGYISYDAVQHFNNIRFVRKANEYYQIPEVKYCFYKYIIGIDHHKNRIHIVENLTDGDTSQIGHIHHLLIHLNFTTGNFRTVNGETSNISDTEYMEMVSKGIACCRENEISQIVLSRQFSIDFEGDEFNIYRALRSINPSPYLFFFDYGDYRIFGSSPEAELRVKNNKAYIHPIAGTFRRTGNDELDQQLAGKISNDPKENAEHEMLVELACEELAKNSKNVSVEAFREVQFYSHVIHLVSRVSGEISDDTNLIKVLGETFPAGTLSGAPKQKAIALIDEYENQNRGFYGGCIGYLGFDRVVNHAIIIRSFLSKNNRLFYQAGAGIVADSNEESELQEVNNKLAALRAAIEMAQNIHV